MIETSFNNRLAQRPRGKQKCFIIESLDIGILFCKLTTLSVQYRQQFKEEDIK